MSKRKYLLDVLKMIETNMFKEWIKDKISIKYDDFFVDGIFYHKDDSLYVTCCISTCRCCPSIERDIKITLDEIDKLLKKA